MDSPVRLVRLPLILVVVTLAIGGCATVQDLPIENVTEEIRRAAQLMQKREKELAAFRAELASTRIAAAKQEAELHELRATVVQLRQENGESHQALLETTRRLATRETEVAAMKMERAQGAQTSSQSGIHDHQLAALQETVMSLSQELTELKSAMVLAVNKSTDSAQGQNDVAAKVRTDQSSTHQRTKSSVSRGDTEAGIIPAVQILREDADRSKSSWITVQTGESWWSLARKHHTTMNALQATNGRVGDHLTVGEAIRLP